jgi:formylglycine-generating enzyme required for sulfatase activity
VTRAALILGALLSACGDRPPDPRPTTASPAPAAPVPRPLVAANTADPPPATPPVPELPAERDGMRLVPAGSFVMGSDDAGEPDERPAHRAEVAAFYLDVTEVTNERWQEAVAAGIVKPPFPDSADKNGFGPDRRFRGPRQPVSSISWFDARAYCGWRKKRLPTEAEFERAARGSDGRVYPWGNDEPTPERARYAGSVTVDVGTLPAGAGPYRHLDLSGNVWEWIEDVYDPFAYTRGAAAAATCDDTLAAFDELRRTHREGFTGTNPIPTECERVLRGGAFNYPASGLRASNRVHHPPRYRLVMSGVRCAQDP